MNRFLLTLACVFFLFSCQSTRTVSVFHPPKALSPAEERLLEWLRERTADFDDTPASTLEWDERLHVAARALALTKATGREGTAQNALPVFLEQAMIYERPVFAAWAEGKDGPACAAHLAKDARSLLHGGFNLLGLARAEGPAGSTCALVVARQDLALTEPPPRVLPENGDLTLAGTLGDDLGRLWLVIQTPVNQVRRESLPLVDGRFEAALRFSLPGRYDVELLRQDAFGTEWRRVAAFPLFYKEPAVPPRTRLDFNLEPSEFGRAAGETVRLIRERRHQGPLPAQAEMKRELLRLAGNGVSIIRPADGTTRGVWIAPDSSAPCSWQRSWTNDLGAYLDATTRSPSHYLWVGRTANRSYTALATEGRDGFLLHEMLCADEPDQEHWIGPAYSYDQQIRYITLVRQAVEGRLGYGFQETDREMLDRHIVSESLLILERRGGTASFLNPEFAAALRAGGREQDESLAWAFTYLWEYYKQARQHEEAGAGSLKLAVILAMLHQGRDHDAWSLSREVVSGEAPDLALARHALVDGWIAGARGDMEQARQAFERSASLYYQQNRVLQARRITGWAAMLAMRSKIR